MQIMLANLIIKSRGLRFRDAGTYNTFRYYFLFRGPLIYYNFVKSSVKVLRFLRARLEATSLRYIFYTFTCSYGLNFIEEI